MFTEPTVAIKHGKYLTGGPAKTPLFPNLSFYSRMLPILLASNRIARRGGWTPEAWLAQITKAMHALENSGCRFEVEGLDNVEALDGPCVYIGNHMSTLETFILPVFLMPYRRLTFVVKAQLVTYPVFGPIMHACEPVTVTRTDPRKDLRDVLEQGSERLSSGLSVVVFPQTTRSYTFDRGHFNSIGTKLAKRAGVPVVPIALKTDAWGKGWPIKDLGPIRPEKTIHFSLGEPMEIAGNGREQHERTMEFIESRLSEWDDTPA
jgi:1-acyl-sn-glycerol-3-phosphate acyltransferase